MVAMQALQSTPILPLEVVDHQAVISHPIHLPLLFTSQLSRKLLELGFLLRRHLNMGFV